MKGLSIAVIGAGGKTTTMRALARHFRDRRVLFTTTTHILPLEPAECRLFLPDPTPDRLLEELSQPGVLCSGCTAKLHKLSSLPVDLLRQAMDRAEVTLYEADGAARLPLKLHREGEPVIVGQPDRCVIVAGLSAMGAPIREVVHRWQLDPEWAADPDRPVDGAVFIRCILDALRAAQVPPACCRVLLNQADRLTDPEAADQICAALREQGLRCRIGSLARDPAFLPGWVLGD